MSALAYKIPSSSYGPHYNNTAAAPLLHITPFSNFGPPTSPSVGMFISFSRIEMTEHHQYRLSTFAHWPNFNIGLLSCPI